MTLEEMIRSANIIRELTRFSVGQKKGFLYTALVICEKIHVGFL